MLLLASKRPTLPGTCRSCSWLGAPTWLGRTSFQAGQQACGEHYSADQQENCQWKEKLSFSQQEKQKICELLMETDGDVGQEVERAQLEKHPPGKETLQRMTRIVCPTEPAKASSLGNSTSTNAAHSPSFFLFCLHFFSTTFLPRWKQQKLPKLNKNRRQLSCNYHSYKEAKQGSKKWLKAREVFEHSLLSVLSFGKLSVLSYEHTEKEVIHEADRNTCGDCGEKKTYVIFFYLTMSKLP